MSTIPASERNAPGSGPRSALPVEPADDRAAGSGAEEGSGDHLEHVDVFVLPVAEAEDEAEDRHAEDRQAQEQQMQPGGNRSAVERQDDVLNEDRSPAVQVGRVGREHEEESDRGEESLDSGRKERTGRHRHRHLVGVLRGVGGELAADGKLFRREGGVGQERVGAERDHRREHRDRQHPPGREDVAHLRLVRILRRSRVALVALPGTISVDKENKVDQNEPDVEIADLEGIERIHIGLPRRLRKHGFAELLH